MNWKIDWYIVGTALFSGVAIGIMVGAFYGRGEIINKSIASDVARYRVNEKTGEVTLMFRTNCALCGKVMKNGE